MTNVSLVVLLPFRSFPVYILLMVGGFRFVILLLIIVLSSRFLSYHCFNG